MDEPHASADSDQPSGLPQFGVKHLLFATAWFAVLLALFSSIYRSGWALMLSVSALVVLSLAARTLLKWNWMWVLSLAGGSLAVVLLVVGSLPGSARQAERRMQCQNNLNLIGLALYNYENKYGSFPPAYTSDAGGRPMHSWRVLVLPFIGTPQAKQFCSQYRFDEPWDGPNNRQLHNDAMPFYRCPSDEHDGAWTQTNYLAVVGPRTAWPDAATTKLADFTDGLSNTILVAEAANSGIHWMEPRDLHITQMNLKINAPSGQGISSHHPGGAVVLWADGSVRLLSDFGMQASAVRAVLTPAAGDRIIDDD